ncbi:protein kinase domain-containing protein [Actinocorallia longicatena]|uniref:Protein kinase domain-containing protein n=1 Tax=Actinocorallia longicatena TaxID=111803 RepID=A0ABP6QIS6_9ACTN
MTKEIRFLDPYGTEVEAKYEELPDDAVYQGSPLRARRLRLEYANGRHEEVLRLEVPAGARDGSAGHRALDNEILARLRISRLCGQGRHPAEIAKLIGRDTDDGSEAFALIEPQSAAPVLQAAGNLMHSEKERFQLSLVTGLRWLSAAGVAHRSISPYSVSWDGNQVRIGDFSCATVVGAPRAVLGTPPWQPPEQRPAMATGAVTAKDDVWAAGRLIYFVLTGRELDHRSQLADDPDLTVRLAGIFGEFDARPAVRELLRRLGGTDPIPRSQGLSPRFQEGLDEFYRFRETKHPGSGRPDDEPPPAAPPPPPPPTPPAAPPRSRTFRLFGGGA